MRMVGRARDIVCLYPIDDMDKAMGGLSEAEKIKVLSGNAAKVYNICV
jgi:hypothetical protein